MVLERAVERRAEQGAGGPADSVRGIPHRRDGRLQLDVVGHADHQIRVDAQIGERAPHPFEHERHVRGGLVVQGGLQTVAV
eukprot:568553-Prymnesium_polylepis.1